MENLKKYIPLNFALMMNPVNWLIVALIVVLGGVALASIIPSTNAFQAEEN